MWHVAYFVERLFAQAITDIGTHGILDENFDYGRSIDEKNKFKTELKTIWDT